MTTYSGSINLILGPMFSSKTTELIRQYYRNTLGGKKCIMVKYANDDRYSKNEVVTHDGKSVEALICKQLAEVENDVLNYDVICIDEVQFYNDGDIYCDRWANYGKTIYACGLNGTFKRTEFPVISRLLPLVENIVFLKAVCKENGNDAIYSKLDIAINSDEIEIIGGSEKYSAVDRKQYFLQKIDK